MKTKEELNALKEEVKTMKEKLSALTEEELEQVTGGLSDEDKREDGMWDIRFFSTEE